MTKDLQFDKRITIGNILSIVSMLVAVFIAYSNIKASIDVMKNDIAWIKTTIASHGSVIPTHLAKSNQ